MELELDLSSHLHHSSPSIKLVMCMVVGIIQKAVIAPPIFIVL